MRSIQRLLQTDYVQKLRIQIIIYYWWWLREQKTGNTDFKKILNLPPKSTYTYFVFIFYI